MSLDKLFILGGKQLKTLVPVWNAPFCTLDNWVEGRYRSEQCLVLTECTTKLDLNIFIFLTTKSNKESMYCGCRGRMFSFDVTTSNVSFLRRSNTGERDVTASPLHDVTRMAYTTPEPHGRTAHRLPSPTAEPDPDYCYMNTLYTMHNTQSQLPVNGNDVTSIATIGTFEAFL